MVELAGGTLDAKRAARCSPRSSIGERSSCPPGFVHGPHRRRLHRRRDHRRADATIGCRGRRTADSGDGWTRHRRRSWRPDLTDKWTLAEEVARIHGLDRIPSVLPTPPSGRGLTAAQQGRRRVAERARGGRASSRRRRSRSRPRRRTTCTAPPSGEHLPEHPAGEPARRPGAVPASLAHPRPAADRAPQHRRAASPISRSSRPVSVFLPEPGVDVRHRRGAAARRAPVGRDPRRAERLDPAAAPSRRGAAHRAIVSRKQPGRAGRARPGSPRRSTPCASIAAAAGVEIDVAQAQRAALHPGRTGVRHGRAATEVGYVGELHPAVAEAADLPGRVVVARARSRPAS